MERRAPKLGEVREFIVKNHTKAMAGVAAGGIAVAPYVHGRVDKLIGIVGGLSACYVAIKVYRHFGERKDGN